MKAIFLYIIFLAYCYWMPAQIIRGRVFNGETGELVSYSNIGIKGKSIGTVSNEEGRFMMSFSQITDKDTLIVSSLGYSSRKFSIKKLFSSSDTISIFLIPKIITLAEVTVKPVKEICLGNNIRKEIHGSWISDNLGSEFGVMMQLGRKRAILYSISFGVIYSDYDSLLFRINVYKVNKGIPGENILSKPIYFRSKGKYPNGITITIDLQGNSIVLNSDFLISLEWIKDMGQKGFFLAFLNENTKNTYIRSASQDAWRLIPHGAGLNCKLGILNFP